MSDPQPIVVEQTYDADIGRVWLAITDGGQMPRWFFEAIPEFRPEPGFETKFNVHNEGRDYLHVWKVTEVIPEKKLVYDWTYEGVPGASVVVWELAETREGTRLRLTHRGGHTFPQDDPAFTRESCQAGWQYFLGERLKAFLEP